MPPKQALFSPWPAGYLNHGGRNDHPFVFIYDSQVAGVAPRKPGKCFTAMHFPPGFGAMNFFLPRACAGPPIHRCLNISQFQGGGGDFCEAYQGKSPFAPFSKGGFKSENFI